MKDLVQRSISGIIFVIVLIAGVSFNQIGFLGLVIFLTIFTQLEFYNLLSKKNIQPQKVLGIVSGVVLFAAAFFNNTNTIENEGYYLVLGIVFLSFVIELFRNKETPFNNIAYTMLGIVYIAVPFTLLNYIVFIPTEGVTEFSPQIMLGILFLIWTFDSGAYLVGVSIGKHRLYEKISPKKSWEGAIGGVVAAIGVSILLSHYFDIIGLMHWIVISIIVSVIGTLGDLSESQFKRSIDVKDSGNFIPGHGGLLDRFDSLLLVSPFVFIYLHLVIFNI